MSVIAMTHEIGTLGRQIASRLAQRLGVDFADEPFLKHRIADRLARDKGSSACGSENGAGFDHCLRVDDRRLARHAADEISELAAYGHIVMRGWGAASLLRDNPHVIRIRALAPMSFRLRVLATRERTRDEGSLRRLIEDSDSCLASNLQPVLGPDWRTGKFYHVMLCTHLLPVDDSVEQLVRFITAKSGRPSRSFQGVVARGLTDRPTGTRSRERPAQISVIDHATIAKAEQLLYGSH